MKPISKAWLCQIDVTNICGKGCVYCSRHDRHIRQDQRYSMSLTDFKKALLSVKEFPGNIGIIGGEPLYHPQFEELCLIIQDVFSKKEIKRVKLWTSAVSLYEKKYKKIIGESFGNIASFNVHDNGQREVCKHQPITMAIGEVVAPGEYRDKLISDCWVQKIWCPTITNKGAFFCEVAGALDTIIDGPGGYPVERGWWKRTPEQFQDQVERYCHLCGMPVPVERQLLKDEIEKVSPKLLKLFKEKNLPHTNSMELFDRQLSIADMEKAKLTWDPGNFRGDIQGDRVE